MEKQNFNMFNNCQSILVVGQLDEREISEITNYLKIAVGDSEIMEGETLKISELRNVLHWLQLKPFTLGKKLIVIKEADKINLETANALLKTLEEPPEYARIVLLTTDEQKILPTIRSRCHRLRISRPQIELCDGCLSPSEIEEMSIKEKFDWAGQTAELGPKEIFNILTSWQEYYRKEMLSGRNVLPALTRISQAKDLLQTNISVKLLLENLTLSL